MQPLLPAVLGAVCLTLCFALNDVIDESWKANYKPWRLRDPVSVSEWVRGIPPPVPAIPAKTWDEMELPARRTHFKECITQEAQRLSKHVEAYRSPNLIEVQQVTASLRSGMRTHRCD
jgi:hypothetical protein